MRRKHPNWLRFQVENYMKTHHADLLNEVKIQRRKAFVNKLLSLNHWYLTVLGTVLFYLILTCVAFFTDITLEDYPAFIDQRSSNLATISGMCLAVITFLMSNIAVKEPYAYKLLFTSTKMYAAIFFVLTNLGCFIIVSTLRDTINEAYYPYFVVASSIVFLTVLFVIGYLFSQAIYYTNPQKIDEFMNRELQLNASVILFHGLMRKYGLERYRGVMAQQGAKTYLPGNHVDQSWTMSWKTKTEIIAKEKEQQYVLDLNMVQLANYVQAAEKPVYYRDLAFNELTDQTDQYVFREDEENSSDEKKTLKDILWLTTHGEDFLNVSEIREHFDEKMVLYSEKGQSRELQRIIDGLNNIFRFQQEHQLPVPFNVTADFLKVVRKAITVSVKENKYDCFEKLVLFFYGHSNLAIREKNQTLFADFLSLNIYVYGSLIERKGNLAYRDILNLGLDASGLYHDFFYYLSKMEEKKNEKETQASAYAKILYESFSQLMFFMVQHKDRSGLKRAVKLLVEQFGVFSDYDAKTELDELKSKPLDDNTYKLIKKLKLKYLESKQPQIFRRHALLGIKSWVFHLLHHSQINSLAAIEMTKGMTIRYLDNDDALEDIFFIKKGGPAIGYFGWLGWTFQEGDDDDDFTISDPTNWLTFGFMAEQIIQFGLPYISDNLDIEDFQYIGVLKEQLITIKKLLEDDIDKWKDVLKANDEADLKAKSQKVIDYFTFLEQRKDAIELKRIADASLDTVLVSEQIEAAQAAWTQNAHIYQLFKELGQAKVSPDDLGFVGEQGYASKYKQFFIENGERLSILATTSSTVARDMDDHFLRVAILGAAHTGKAKTLGQVIVKGMQLLKEKEIKPAYIMIEPYNHYTDDELQKHEDFRPNPGTAQRSSPLLFGWFRSIPIYMFHNQSLINKVIIAEAPAFELEYQEFEGRYEKILDLSVREVIEIEAQKIYDEKGFQQMSDEEKKVKILEIKNGIHLSIGANYQFNIVDNSAYFSGTIG